MENLEYLFSFDFEKGCMNDYLIKFCKDTQTDFFYHLNVLYIDLFGTGIYNAIKIIHVAGCRNEVYYIKNNTMSAGDTYIRSYPQVEKALKVEPYENTYYIKATFENGDCITTRINGCKKIIEDYYLNRIYDMSCDPEKELFVRCNNVEFLEVVN